MATDRQGHKPGGGIASKVNVQTPVRTGSGSKGISPGWVAQRGQKQGDHVTNRGDGTGYRGEPKFTGQNFQPVKFGNELATNVGKGGPGAGRTIHSCGSQGMTGSGGPQKPAGRDILSSFGPESSRAKGD